MKRARIKRRLNEPVEPPTPLISEQSIFGSEDPIDTQLAKLKKQVFGSNRLTTDPDTLELIRRLGEIQCNNKEAASVLGVGHTYFTKWLARNPTAQACWDAGQDIGRMSLRRRQFHIALYGQNQTGMCIWLGKQYLGQQDMVKQDVKMEVSNDEATRALRAEIDAMALRLGNTDPVPVLPSQTIS
jgi:hypothetical protein